MNRSVGERHCQKQRDTHEAHHWYDAKRDQWVKCYGEELSIGGLWAAILLGSVTHVVNIRTEGQ